LSYNEALNCLVSKKWKVAMDSEYSSFKKNKAWNLIDLPPSRQPINSKWIFTLKNKPDGSIECYKAKLVAKGYSQVQLVFN
jgi:hypothetical protein